MTTKQRPTGRATVPLVRCAIYTRKSTEEGLEQQFNSLDAQRESAEAYIRSQQQIIANIETRAEQLVDARPRGRFEGTVAEPRPDSRSGHIPGSRNVPYAALFDAKTGAMKSLDELTK